MTGPLEPRLATVEDKVKLEAIARRSMEDDLDRIQRTLDSHTGVLDGLGRTQREHTRALNEMLQVLRDQSQGIKTLQDNAEILGAGLDRVTNLLERLIERGRNDQT